MRGGTPEGITRQIFAIGGGDLQTRETYDIDKQVVESSGRTRPWTLCITAAANDSPEACDSFGNIYGDSLRCRTDYLRVIKGEPGGDDFQRKINRSEVFYFSDGDLALLMDTLTKNGVLPILKAAFARGAVFAGSGAGAACLGQYGMTGTSGVQNGIGVVDFGICALGQSKVKDEVLGSAAADHKKPAIVLASLTAVHVVENSYRIIGSTEKLSARVARADKSVSALSVHSELQGTDSLSKAKVMA